MHSMVFMYHVVILYYGVLVLACVMLFLVLACVMVVLVLACVMVLFTVWLIVCYPWHRMFVWNGGEGRIKELYYYIIDKNDMIIS